jgi:RimJ/RimL family protein N-acetyltransferase
MTTTQTGIEQHREYVENLREQLNLRNQLAEIHESDADDNLIDDVRHKLMAAESELEEWEADLERSPIDAHVSALDETGHWNIDAEHAPYIKAIRGVYLFDRNERTHCCEITPSHYLIHLYDQVIFTDAGEELDDYAKDDIYQTYEYTGQSEDIYVHCRTVDRMIAKATKPGLNFDHYHDGTVNAPYADTKHAEQMEALREHFCGNHYI